MPVTLAGALNVRLSTSTSTLSLPAYPAAIWMVSPLDGSATAAAIVEYVCGTLRVVRYVSFMRCGVFVHEDLPLIVRVEHKYEVLGSCRRRSSFIRLSTELKIDLTTIEPTCCQSMAKTL